MKVETVKAQSIIILIPGMRKPGHAKVNMKTSDEGPLDSVLMKELEKHRWDREPKTWSQ
jgi:hypothetical protein